MNFMTAVKTCLRKYFIFSGRARRSEFWWFILFTIIVSILLSVVDSLLFGANNPFSSSGTSVGVNTGEGPLSSLFNLLIFIPTLSAGWRRLHDTNRSGWWLGAWFLTFFALIFMTGFILTAGAPSLLSVVAGIVIILMFVWFVALIVFYCLDSHHGDNRFGPSPKYGGQADAFD